MITDELYMFNSRDKAEFKRLNKQHEVLADVMGYELLHPSLDITKSTVNIADVGTGTGIWLQKLSSKLQSRPGHGSYYLHGFDISSAQFPIDTQDIQFSIHDATKRFPEEHLNSYDIVHIRLFDLALKEPELRQAMDNAVQLLQPGGYLQWEDCDFGYTAPNRPSPDLTKMIQMVIAYSTGVGFSMQVSDTLMDEGKLIGLESLRKYLYSTLEHPEFYHEAQDWFTQVFRALLPVTLIRTRRVPDEAAAQKLTGQMLQLAQSAYSEGVVPRLHITTVIGRRLSPSA